MFGCRSLLSRIQESVRWNKRLNTKVPFIMLYARVYLAPKYWGLLEPTKYESGVPVILLRVDSHVSSHWSDIFVIVSMIWLAI